MDITASIRAELAYKNMTLDQLAESISMSRKSLSQRMNGHTDFRLAEIVDISDALNVSVVALFGRATKESVA